MHVFRSSDRPAISVIIPVRNEGGRLLTALSSIVEGRSRVFALQIVVVDDDSSDGCCDSVHSLYSWSRDRVRVDVVRLRRWAGIPYARNVGATAALADIMFTTDGNIRFPTSWDLRIRERIGPRRVLCATITNSNSSFRGYGGTLHIPSMGFSWLRSPAQYGGYVPLSPCTGTIISTELFRRVGGYDTAMPVYGAAEPEFSVRLWLSGAEIICMPDLLLEHRFRPAAERRPFLDAISLTQVYNYLRFGLLYLDRPRVLQLFRHYATNAPHLFGKALRQVWSSDVWDRRDLLLRTLPARFDFFVRRFGIVDAHGQLATEAI